MIIGVLREIMHSEQRVSAIPETVKKMVDSGAEVLFQSEAGIGSHYADEAYKEAGAKIISDPQVIFEKSEIIEKYA